MLCNLLAQVASAQTPRSGAGESTRLQQALQQANSDKAALAEENKQLKEQLKKLETDTTAAKKDRDSLSGRVNQAESQAQRAEVARTAADSNLEITQQRLQEVVSKYRELAENAKQIETDRNRATGELAASRRELDSCKSANVDLAGIAEDALTHYEQKGVFAALAQKDPFTGIQRARIDNLVDAYRAEVDAKRITPAAAGAKPSQE
jgi:chromosome segregation ATPase